MVEIKHPNGYIGILYGESSYVVLDKDGKEILHTGSRNINTKEEIYRNLENIPKLIEAIKFIDFDNDFEDEEEG